MTSGTRGIRPVVYVGPTITPSEVASVLPTAEIRPPVRRGDLHRDRMLRYTTFVVIDGVFHQHAAISPREVIDVVGDGALVIGASSMGAIRAAECWPAGMLGVGAIYRLFRRGSLGSDDEVAVAFDPEHPGSTTVALVNVRASLRRAVRAGRLDAAVAERIVLRASELDYRDRRWRLILRAAGIPDAHGDLAKWLGSHDLKRSDAVVALRHVARTAAHAPELLHRPRLRTTPFAIGGPERERRQRPLGAERVEAVKPDFARWLVASGVVEQRSLVQRDDTVAIADWIEVVWERLEEQGELEPLLFRWRAIRTARSEAERLAASPNDDHVRAAGDEMASAHDADSFERVADRWEGSEVGSWLVAYRSSLAWAKCLGELLSPPRVSRGAQRPPAP